MKSFFLIAVIAFLAFSFTGCALMDQADKPGNGYGIFVMPPYSGLKARVMVADFEVKNTKATVEIGNSLREILAAALGDSNRFITVDRQALNVTALKQEAVRSTQAGQPIAAVEKTKAKNADIIVMATVTEFEPETSGGGGGMGGGGGVASGALGGLLGASSNKARMSLDIRIIDALTSDPIAATLVQGQASDTNGSRTGELMKNWNLKAGLSAYANTPMEKAVRICLIEALRYIVQSVPAKYYKY